MKPDGIQRVPLVEVLHRLKIAHNHALEHLQPLEAADARVGELGPAVAGDALPRPHEDHQALLLLRSQRA